MSQPKIVGVKQITSPSNDRPLQHESRDRSPSQCLPNPGINVVTECGPAPSMLRALQCDCGWKRRMCKTENLGSVNTIDLRQTAICRIGQRMEGCMQPSADSIVKRREIFQSRKYELMQPYFVNPVNSLSLVPDLTEATDSEVCSQPV